MFLQFLSLDGKAFHTVGPAWKKARSPKVFRVTLGITSNVSEIYTNKRNQVTKHVQDKKIDRLQEHRIIS